MSKEIIELLSKEIESFDKAKKALIEVGNVLKKEGTEDEHLKKLYLKFEGQIKACQTALDALSPKQPITPTTTPNNQTKQETK